MENKPNENRGGDLPACAAEFIRQIGRRMRYRRKASADVEAELMAHFEDELHGCTDTQERQQKAQRLIAEFGDAKVLAALCRRAKKRCRPAWARAIVRTVQGAGVMLLLFVVYTAWFLHGKPAPTVDYLVMLNQMSRPQIADRDNAWPRYEKAFAAIVDPNTDREVANMFRLAGRPDFRGLADLPQEDQQLITNWVAENNDALQEFAAAAATPYCHREYTYAPGARQGWLVFAAMPNLNGFRTLGRLAILRSRVNLERGDVQQAIADCLTSMRAGRHLRSSKTLIEQLVGLALTDMGDEGILRIVRRAKFSAADLANLQRELALLDSASSPFVDIEGERAVILDTIQRVFTDCGPGGGHMAPASFADIREMETTDGMHDFLSNEPLVIAVSMLHAGRNDTVAKVNWLFDEQAKLAKLSPYQRHVAQTPSDGDLLKSLPQYRYGMLHVMVPSVGRIATLAFRDRAVHEATVTVVALQRYRVEKGAYPASLDELKQAGYIDALPADPYSDGSLVYKVLDDRFTLYSVGPDFKDDGGKPGTDRKGNTKMWDAPTGDAVFWPLTP